MEWLINNYVYLIGAIGAGIAMGVAITKMTPSKKDDEVMKKIQDIFKKIEDIAGKKEEEKK
jgi:hypothetical protein